MATGLAAVLLSGLSAPTASAALALGGGAGIVVDGTYCTLATIGHDNTGELVGFTAAHCGGPGSQVVAEGTDTTVGTMVAANGELDYAVIKFDPATVTPIHDFAGFVISGIGPNPERGQPECRLGAATGYFCSFNGTFPGRSTWMIMPWGDYQPGDDGAPVTSDALLVGMIISSHRTIGDLLGTPQVQHTRLTKFSAILDDVNSSDGPGAGFTPIGS